MKETGGEPASSNDLPSAETIREAANYILLDSNGRTHTFQSLCSGHNIARRVLVIFVRHFFCGNCKEFLRSPSGAVTPEALLGLPISTFITIVGCGNPALIDGYFESTNSYMRKSMAQSITESFFEALRLVPSRMALKSGYHRQIGGEFLFEPLNVASPDPQMALNLSHDEQTDDAPVEPKRVTWCHRMTTTRDHAEMPELMEILGLETPAELSDKGQEAMGSGDADAQRQWSDDSRRYAQAERLGSVAFVRLGRFKPQIPP